MKPHPRIRKTIKWGGAAVTVLLVVVWIGSGFGTAYSSADAATFGFDRGRLFFAWSTGPGWILVEDGFFIPPPSPTFDMKWKFDSYHSWFGWGFTIPIWFPFIVVSLVTVSTWCLDTLARRRAMLNLCAKCGYDCTGILKDSKCPECGSTPS